MFCENCGARIDDDSKFCENCGEPVKAGEEITFQEECAASTPDPVDESKTEEPNPTEKPDAATEEPDAAEGSDVKENADDLNDLEDLMEFSAKDDFLDFPDKTMVFVKASKEQEVPVKIGIDPEDEFFVEPNVGAVHRSLPLIDLGEEEPELEEAEESPEKPEEPKDYQNAFDALGGSGALEDRQAQAAGDGEEREENKETVEPEAQEEAAANGEAATAIGEEMADASPEPASTAASGGEPRGGFKSEPLFCMACGKPLPEGAAFCDACGTRTGAVSPAEIRSRKQSKQGLAFGLLADFFIKPESTIEKAADEAACLSGIAFFLLKNVILAVLAAAFMKKITVSLGLLGSLLTDGDSFGFAAKVFLCAIVMDALWIGILFGAGYLFRTDCPIKILIGACGTASLLPTALLIVATLLIAFVPVITAEVIAITALVTLIVMTKAAAAAFIPPQDRLLYMMAVATSVYAVIIVAAMGLMGVPLVG